MALGNGIRRHLALAAIVAALAIACLACFASAEASNWGTDGGVTDANDYADYDSAVVNNTYRADIEQATALGLIVGHDDRTYRPDDNITLGQFANIIARNYGEQGLSDSDNLAFLGSLGVSTGNSDAELTLGQLISIADAVQGMQGVGNLAILTDARNGSLVPDGGGGGISRGQAVDLLASGTGGTGNPTNSGGSDNSDDHSASVRGTLSPNPVRAGQSLTVTIRVSHVNDAWVEFPWGSVTPARVSSSRYEGTTLVPLSVAAGDYTVTFRGTNHRGDSDSYQVRLTVTADPLTDVGFVITD